PYRLEFFVNAGCDSSGNGEGARGPFPVYVSTDVMVWVSFSASLPVATSPNAVITATATDSSNNTSEFSPCIPTRESLVAYYVRPSPKHFVLKWPFAAGEASVESTTNLIDWAPVPQAPVRVGDWFYVTNLVSDVDSRFFRLRQP